ncbi:MAG: hypothetical protein PHC80_02215 [Eubacteriales bacterium]|nr:hypothetical protein [Eubacteriales bacterium]
MITYYFIVVVIIATALTIWDKATKNKKKNGAGAPSDDTMKNEEKPR